MSTDPKGMAEKEKGKTSRIAWRQPMIVEDFGEWPVTEQMFYKWF